MWRAFFLAVGVFICILGAECLGVEKVVLKLKNPPPRPTQEYLVSEAPAAGSPRELVPPDYAPWSLMGLGAVVILYAYDLPKRVNG
ncbi:MAG: hypothetical protein JW818_02565 [Pirellulales bacterium]|nr:hypothetical protein [Pirellulales bacterium]